MARGRCGEARGRGHGEGREAAHHAAGGRDGGAARRATVGGRRSGGGGRPRGPKRRRRRRRASSMAEGGRAQGGPPRERRARGFAAAARRRRRAPCMGGDRRALPRRGRAEGDLKRASPLLEPPACWVAVLRWQPAGRALRLPSRLALSRSDEGRSPPRWGCGEIDAAVAAAQRSAQGGGGPARRPHAWGGGAGSGSGGGVSTKRMRGAIHRRVGGGRVMGEWGPPMPSSSGEDQRRGPWGRSRAHGRSPGRLF